MLVVVGMDSRSNTSALLSGGGGSVHNKGILVETGRLTHGSSFKVGIDRFPYVFRPIAGTGS
ncbi:hypothetical protein [Bifidobacterium magnum]|uniref:hypothetical protein n=1 Tax=Bifidobacterium magnum TaxID=1692 RepID=UPI00138AB328|nr:hypothetical protein [Bifidobacterium magnum]